MTDETIKAIDNIIEAEVRRRVNIVETALPSQINVPTVSIPNYPHKPAPPLADSEPTQVMAIGKRIAAIEKHMEFLDGHTYPAVPDLINRMDKIEERLESKSEALRRLNVDRFDELESKATSAGGMLDMLDKRIESNEADICRIESVGKALHRIEDRLVEAEGSIRSHARQLTDHSNRMSDMYNKLMEQVSDHNGRLTNIYGDIGKLATQVDTVEKSGVGASVRVDAYGHVDLAGTVKDEIRGVQHDIGRIQADIERLEVMAESVDGMKRIVANTSSAYDDIKARLFVVEDYQRAGLKRISKLEEYTGILKKGTESPRIDLT